MKRYYHIGMGEPGLPTYRSAADFLEKKNASGLALLGWTVARAGLIFLPFPLVGVAWQKALIGSAIASGMITTFAVIRIKREGDKQ